MISFDTPGPRRRGGDASAGFGLSGADRSVAFSIPDGFIGGRGGKPFRRRTSSFSCWFSHLAVASPAFSFPFSSRSRSTSPISPRTNPTSSVRLIFSSESIAPGHIPGFNQAFINDPFPPRNLPRLHCISRRRENRAGSGQPEHPYAGLSLCRLPRPEARRLVQRFEWHYTPKHGSWLD